MKKINLIVFTTALIAIAATGIANAVNVDKAIEARKGLMQIYAFNLGILGDMAKGKAEYNAETANTAAQNLLVLASMKNGAMWPQGSGNDQLELADKTRALPEIWSTYPEIGQRGADMISALEDFSDAAGKDLASLQGGMKAVGQACKGCHESFRAEDD